MFCVRTLSTSVYSTSRTLTPPVALEDEGEHLKFLVFFVLFTLTTLYSEGLKMVERNESRLRALQHATPSPKDSAVVTVTSLCMDE